MATAPADKKPNPNAIKPKQNLLMIGGVLIVLGLVWFVYQVPGLIRAETTEEKKERLEMEQIAEEKRRDDEAEARRHKK